MAGRAAGLIVVLDASTFVSAALKANSIPERALLRAIGAPNRLALSQAVEDEYREVVSRPKFDRFVSVERRRRILDIVVVGAERVEPTEAVRECLDPNYCPPTTELAASLDRASLNAQPDLAYDTVSRLRVYLANFGNLPEIDGTGPVHSSPTASLSFVSRAERPPVRGRHQSIYLGYKL
jgi:hypothetical protein